MLILNIEQQSITMWSPLLSFVYLFVYFKFDPGLLGQPFFAQICTFNFV